MISTKARTKKVNSGAKAEAYYEKLGDDLILGKNDAFQDEEKTLWFNMGYWKESYTYEDACKAYAKLVADFSEFKPDDHLLDIGFGFGEQDFYWKEKYDLGKITGINISPTQVKIGMDKVKELGYEGQVHFQTGDATNLEFEDNSFEKIIALDCAYHFNTREDFFHEAYRTLKPGGRLVVTDVLPYAKTRVNFIKRFLLNKHAIPPVNMYSKEVYAEKLKNAGFLEPRIETIGQHVFQGVVKYHLERKKGKRIKDIKVFLNPKDDKIFRTTYRLTGMNEVYVFIVDKPL